MLPLKLSRIFEQLENNLLLFIEIRTFFIAATEVLIQIGETCLASELDLATTTRFGTNVNKFGVWAFGYTFKPLALYYSLHS